MVNPPPKATSAQGKTQIVHAGGGGPDRVSRHPRTGDCRRAQRSDAGRHAQAVDVVDAVSQPPRSARVEPPCVVDHGSAPVPARHSDGGNLSFPSLCASARRVHAPAGVRKLKVYEQWARGALECRDAGDRAAAELSVGPAAPDVAPHGDAPLVQSDGYVLRADVPRSFVPVRPTRRADRPSNGTRARALLGWDAARVQRAVERRIRGDLPGQDRRRERAVEEGGRVQVAQSLGETLEPPAPWGQARLAGHFSSRIDVLPVM